MTADYVGTELELFADAVNWKSYLEAQIRPFLGPNVLEVGAGIGSTTSALCKGPRQRWVCLEPDPALVVQIRAKIERGELPSFCQPVVGTLDSPELAGALFDSILYVDVLEHIERDREQLVEAAKHLAPSGFLIVMSPAHQALYTDFDRAIGHFRRYSKQQLLAVLPQGPGKTVAARYLDSVGVLASGANRVLLRSSMPTKGQILLWDRLMVPASRVLDRWIGYQLGKSVLAVWQRASER